MTEIPGVVLAGGRSSRMGGGDKCLLELGGKPILDHVIKRLRRQADPLAINANGDPSRFRRYGLPVVADSVSGFAGPLAGVLAGMDWASGLGARMIVTVAADTPFFPEDLVLRMAAAAEADGSPLAMAVTRQGHGAETGLPAEGWPSTRHPTFGLWEVALRDDLRHALKSGVRKVVAWTVPHGCVHVEFPVHRFDPFFNVNTPDDMAKAECLLRDIDT